MTADTYSIQRIRLLNFHNFVSETIDLKNGGHLFLLGDNGCGKTTILDAVHYILTAGKEMEWNSAARLSGVKRDGRRVQGIVLRYNIDTGILNTGGAITYAALEIAGRQGKPLSIGIGISATAMEERIGFWGFIKECTLEELPFTIAENGEIRPASRQEFKQQLESSHGFYTNQTAYRKDLGDRLFGGEESYLDICRFLAMGKSYREISAGAADYHQLFKSLLPEPRSSIFEQIIVALQSLDESQALLDDLSRKLDWLHGLGGKLDSISESRQGELRYEWLLHHFIIEQTLEEEQRCREGLDQLIAELAACQERLIELERLDLDVEGRLHTLQIKDSAGLVNQEKHCQSELQRKQQTLDREQEAGKGLRTRLKNSERELRKVRDSFDKLLKRLQPELASRGAVLPFSLSELQVEIDAISRCNDPEALTLPSPQPTLAQCDQHLYKIIEEKTIIQQGLREYKERILAHQQEREHLEKRRELVPQVARFEAFEQVLTNNMITFRPLFQGLEWSPALKQQQRNSIEECIGEEILAALLLRPSDYSRAREHCTDFPGLRICHPPAAVIELPQWMHHSFDLRESDPECLRALALEMESTDRQPAVSMVAGKPVLAFRSHERTLLQSPARLIGAESRNKALADRINLLNNTIQECEREQKALQKQHDDLNKAHHILQETKEFVTQSLAQVHQGFAETRNAGRELDALTMHLERQQQSERYARQEVEVFARRAAELKELIDKEGLIQLEKLIKRLKQEQHHLSREKDALNQSIGGKNKAKEQLEQTLETLSRKRQTRGEQLTAVANRLQETLEPGTDPAYFVLKTKKGQQFKNREAIEKEITFHHEAVIKEAEQVRIQLNNPEFGGAFRFFYEESLNQLYDFRQQPLAAIIELQSRNLNEQQEVMNERTRELFKKIIMTDLMHYLRGHVGELESMAKRINTLLQNRTFGNQRYSFKIRPVDEFMRLIGMIKKISPFDPAGENELKQFFEDHRDAIIATEPGTIPEELDYRNWYRYEMMVSTVGEEGQVIDRRIKSLGSGGEQAVPNYLLILTIAHFMYHGKRIRLHTLLFDEAFYGIDAGRRDQILGFATDLDLQLFIASPDQDGVRQEVRNSTTILVKKDSRYDVHLYPFHWINPVNRQMGLFDQPADENDIAFGDEL
ncbi:MAG: hypothetical protein JZU50_05210 [Desulfobulbaceae bacterium]|nr:hypothetical protein [Desulfobulbaceae bacterium]